MNVGSSFSPRLTPSQDTSLGFDALKLAQEQMGRGSTRPLDTVNDREGRARSSVDKVTPSVSALDQKDFSGVAYKAKIKKINSLVDSVLLYYKGDQEDLKREKDYLISLDASELDALAVAYEIASTHVLIMTSDLHAQKEAVLSNLKIRKFYESKDICSTDDQIDMDRADRIAKNSAKARGKR